MHIYQKQILDALREHNQLRYSQLQPDDVESSHFKYHLNQLMKDGLVEQISRGTYALTLQGQAAVDRLSRNRTNPHQTPKVISYTLLSDQTQYYLQRKDKEPYRDLLNMIGGKVHQGETTAEASRREVFEKTGLRSDNHTLRGIVEVRTFRDEQLVTHAIAFIYTATCPEDLKNTEHLIGVTRSELSGLDDLAPDLLDIVQQIEQGTPLFSTALTYHL